MGDHLALLVNRLLTESTIHAAIESRNRAKQVEEGKDDVKFLVPNENDKELSSPRKWVECRICQDEDFDSNMETPCSCCGSLKYAHRRCVQRWCNEKGDTMCEICHQPFIPGYSAPPPLFQYRHLPINFRRNWQISRRELAQSQLMEAVSSDHALLDSDLEEPSSRSIICRFAVAVIVLTLSLLLSSSYVISLFVSIFLLTSTFFLQFNLRQFISLLILRHTLPIMVGGADEFVLPLIILAALRVAGILMLVYFTMTAITGLRRRRNQDDTPTFSESSSEEENEHPDLQQSSHVIQIP